MSKKRKHQKYRRYTNQFISKAYTVPISKNGKVKIRSDRAIFWRTLIGFIWIWIFRGKKAKARYLTERFNVTYMAAYKLLKEEKQGFIRSAWICSNLV